MDLLNNQQFIRVIRKLGEGTFGKVFLIEDTRDRKEYAIKIASNQKDALRLLVRESILLKFASDKCDHIVKFVTTGTLNDGNRSVFALLMEYVPGVSLADVDLRALHNQPTLFKNVIKKTLQALECLHSYGIAHRDIKPDNIIISNNEVRLLDFGLGCLTDPSVLSESAMKPLCDPHKIVGNVLYSSPELLPFWVDRKSTNITDEMLMATDVYALGLIFYRFANLNSHSSEERYLDRYVDDFYLNAPNFKVDYPRDPKIEKTIQAALTYDYKERPTAGKLLEILE